MGTGRVIYSVKKVTTMVFNQIVVLLFFTVLLLSACENDLKEVERIAHIEAEEPVDISYGVTVVYSDSAWVKAKLISSKMIKHNIDSPFYEFPKDVLLIFFDKNKKEERRVTADYGLYYEKKDLVELRHHVVVKMADGTVFKSEELFWDNTKRIFYNNLPLTVKTPNGDVFEGTSFEADETFAYRHVNNARFLYRLQEGEGL